MLIRRLLFLGPLETFFLDILAWFMFHFWIGYWTSRLPLDRFNPEDRLFKTRDWEDRGLVYQNLFHVRAWKDYVPSGAKLYKGAYSIKSLASVEDEELERWIKESCRAEFCHWFTMLPAPLFFMWNSQGAGLGMILYAVLNNLVPIIVQRYNRPRLQAFLDSRRRHEEMKGTLCPSY